jgi:hypothetical protein
MRAAGFAITMEMREKIALRFEEYPPVDCPYPVEASLTLKSVSAASLTRSAKVCSAAVKISIWSRWCRYFRRYYSMDGTDNPDPSRFFGVPPSIALSSFQARPS